jgi:hypothetical protein
MQRFSSREHEIEIYDQSDCPFCPGELIVISGIYEICHRDEPRVKVLLVRNTIFPMCKRCADEVRYKMVRAAPHISEDPDFVENVSNADIATATSTSLGVSSVQLGFSHGFRYSQECLEARREGS